MFGGCQLPSIRPSRFDSNSWILVRHEANVHAEVLKSQPCGFKCKLRWPGQVPAHTAFHAHCRGVF